MRYISIILLLSFTVTSSYAAVGLHTTPIRGFAEDSEFVAAENGPRLQLASGKTQHFETRLYTKDIRLDDGYIALANETNLEEHLQIEHAFESNAGFLKRFNENDKTTDGDNATSPVVYCLGVTALLFVALMLFDAYVGGIGYGTT